MWKQTNSDNYVDYTFCFNLTNSGQMQIKLLVEKNILATTTLDDLTKMVFV